MPTGWPVREGGMKLLLLAMCWELCTDIRDLLWLLSHERASLAWNNSSVTGMLTGTAWQNLACHPKKSSCPDLSPLCPKLSSVLG